MYEQFTGFALKPYLSAFVDTGIEVNLHTLTDLPSVMQSIPQCPIFLLSTQLMFQLRRVY